jgi:hypothetical protein
VYQSPIHNLPGPYPGEILKLFPLFCQNVLRKWNDQHSS